MDSISIPDVGALGSSPLSSTPVPQSRGAASPALSVGWARHLDEVRAAQRLRHQIFAGELGAKLPTDQPHSLPGHDVDHFDDFCEHLLVRDQVTQKVVGTYRLLTPSQARRAGGLYSEGEFDCSALAPLRNDMVELGRSCVHQDYRSGAAILALWGALADFMQRNRLQSMVGCASLPLHHPGLTYGEGAARIWAQLPAKSHCQPQWHVRPLLPLPLREAEIAAQPQPVVELPPLVHGYLRMGARVLGAPAWDPDFQTADLPIMLQIADLPARYRRMLGC
ncbi:GNAT family N-acetyltransferase [Comamonas sp. UBA7528]|uniref:GNAT family N-acetyltransferase n=1 Tax=Comamonas sp. UBA7528 TaxID=1946391 RepID=UPI0025BF76E4|nr:GNAT family N-acyltransferase [Comamonas sp. UBA7528]